MKNIMRFGAFAILTLAFACGCARGGALESGATAAAPTTTKAALVSVQTVTEVTLPERTPAEFRKIYSVEKGFARTDLGLTLDEMVAKRQIFYVVLPYDIKTGVKVIEPVFCYPGIEGMSACFDYQGEREGKLIDSKWLSRFKWSIPDTRVQPTYNSFYWNVNEANQFHKVSFLFTYRGKTIRGSKDFP